MTATHTLRLLIASLTFCLLVPAWGADYGELVNKARDQLQDENFIEALATAKDAVHANSQDYKGHYYEAMAYMSMNRFDDADDALSQARSLAPDNAKAGVEKLATAISNRRQGTGSVQAADAALAEGMFGKAARLYEQAWNAGQKNFELGLKSANLYANKLGQPLDAARVLRQVKNAASGNPAADRADTELKKMADTLRKIAKTHIDASYGVSCTQALASLQQAEDADPDVKEIYNLRAQCAAQGNLVGFQVAIKELAKHDMASASELFKLPRIAGWMNQPAFTEFLGDMLGKAQVDALNNMLRLQQEREVAERISVENLLKTLETEMVPIAVGSFDMGSNDSNGNEQPIHRVSISKPFAIARTEVTQGQWKAVMGANPSERPGNCDSCPVENVRWDEVQTFIKKLNMTGMTYRLPSEAEWEYACRAGDNDTYCGSDYLSRVAVACYKNCDFDSAQPVATKKANSWGLFDMSGNVSEIVQDCWHQNFNGAPDDGSPWENAECPKRVSRGGEWANGDWSARVAHRGIFFVLDSIGSHWRSSTTGFRLAKTLP